MWTARDGVQKLVSLGGTYPFLNCNTWRLLCRGTTRASRTCCWVWGLPRVHRMCARSGRVAAISCLVSMRLTLPLEKSGLSTTEWTSSVSLARGRRRLLASPRWSAPSATDVGCGPTLAPRACLPISRTLLRAVLRHARPRQPLRNHLPRTDGDDREDSGRAHRALRRDVRARGTKPFTLSVRQRCALGPRSGRCLGRRNNSPRRLGVPFCNLGHLMSEPQREARRLAVGGR